MKSCKQVLEDGTIEYRLVGPTTPTREHYIGSLHRKDGPAKITPKGCQYWYRWGKLHREGGPAILGDNYEAWYVFGTPHREDGPAIIYHGIHHWYRWGKYHREDGPALTCSDGEIYWFLNGVELSPLEYYELLDKSPSQRKPILKAILRRNDWEEYVCADDEYQWID